MARGVEGAAGFDAVIARSSWAKPEAGGGAEGAIVLDETVACGGQVEREGGDENDQDVALRHGPSRRWTWSSRKRAAAVSPRSRAALAWLWYAVGQRGQIESARCSNESASAVRPSTYAMCAAASGMRASSR